MPEITVNTQISAPSVITINLIREDFLDTSNTFRIIFEVTLTIFSALLGSIISLVNEKKDIPALIWIFFVTMTLGCIVFLILSIKNYRKAKSNK